MIREKILISEINTSCIILSSEVSTLAAGLNIMQYLHQKLYKQILGPSCKGELGICRIFGFLCNFFHQVAQYGAANISQMFTC